MSDDDELFRLARGDIPERYARPVCASVSPSGRWAIALIAANEQPAVEIDLTQFAWEDGRWCPHGSGGASGVTWSSFGDEEVLTSPLVAPNGARAAVFAWGGQEHEVAVQNGYATLVLWNEPAPDYFGELPRVQYFVLRDGTKVHPADDGGR